MFAIVVRAKGLEHAPEKLKRFKVGVLARVQKMLALIGEDVASRTTEQRLSGPRDKDHLGRVSGDLARSINYKLLGNRVVIGTNLSYAAAHEFGATIVPKTANRLVFKLLSGQWRSAKQVVIPARPFLRPTLKASIDPARSIIQRLADEALQEAMG